MIYQNEKNFYCNAFNESSENTFIIFRHNNQFFSVETFVDFGNENNVCIWDSMKEMVDGIAWHDWIVEGILNEELLNMINIIK